MTGIVLSGKSSGPAQMLLNDNMHEHCDTAVGHPNVAYEGALDLRLLVYMHTKSALDHMDLHGEMSLTALLAAGRANLCLG